MVLLVTALAMGTPGGWLTGERPAVEMAVTADSLVPAELVAREAK
jgi:hypothetical protein